MATVHIQPDRAPTVSYWRECAMREVTVVIPAFRNLPYLAAAIESALHAPAAAVLIADDACGDAEREVFTRFQEAHRPRLRIIQSDTQRGIAANLNEAIGRVRTPYFVRLDCDDVLHPEHVVAAYRLLAENPDLAAVAGGAVRIGGDEHLDFQPGTLPPYRPDPNPRILRGVDAFRFALVWDPNPSSSGTVFRAAAFHDVGAFNPKVPWGEDWEIWFRFAQRWDVAYMDAPSALYRIHPSATTSLYTRESRLCYGYDFIYRRAAKLCPYPDLKPQFRRAFLKTARLYAGAAFRNARRLRWESLKCCGRAAQSLAAAAKLG
jgi:glycosyltransferase involved in cell wall biosynthesis